MRLTQLQLRYLLTEYFVLVLSVVLFMGALVVNKFLFLSPPLRITITCIALGYVPGLLLWDIIFRAEKITVFEAIPYCFAISLVWLSFILGLISVFFHFSLSTTVLLIYVNLLLLFIINFAVNNYSPHSAAVYFPRKYFKSILILGVLISGVLIFVFFAGAERGVDSWLFLSIAQQVTRDDGLDLQSVSQGFNNSYVFPVSFIIVSIIAHITSTEVVTVWFYLPLFLTLMSILAMYALAKSLFKAENVALVSTFIFIISLYYQEGYNQVRFFPFTHLSTPDALNIYILFPLFLAAGLRWAHQKSWAPKWLLFLLSIGAMMAIIHNSKYFYAITLLLVASALHAIFWQQDWWFILKMLFIAAAMIVIFAIGFEVAKLALSVRNDLSFISIIENRNTVEFTKVYIDFYPFPSDSQNSNVFYIWVLPVSLLMFLRPHKSYERLAATIIFTGLFIGSMVYFQPQLWGLAMTTIPKLNRFFGQMSELFAPLAWGWVLTVGSKILLTLIQKFYNRRGYQINKIYLLSVILLAVLIIILIAGVLVYLWPREYITWLILQVYPSKYFIFLGIALLLAIFVTYSHYRSRLYSWFESHSRLDRLGEQTTLISMSFLLLFFFLFTPTWPGLFNVKARSPNPNEIIPNEFGEQIAQWWEPELLSFFKNDSPPNARILTQCWPRFFLNPLVTQKLLYDESLYTAFDPRLDLTTYVKTLNDNQIEYILLTNGSSSWFSDCRDERDIMIKNYQFLGPIFAEFPELFEPVYESSKNLVFKVTPPQKSEQLAQEYWQAYQQQQARKDKTGAWRNVQLWAAHHPNLQTRCRARALARPLVVEDSRDQTDTPVDSAEDVATVQAGAQIIDGGGFSLRPDRAVYTIIDGDRFNTYAPLYAEAEGQIPCGAWFVVDLGQIRHIQEVELEWARNGVRQGRLEYWRGGEWVSFLKLTDENYRSSHSLAEPVTASKIRLFLTTATQAGEVGLRRFSLYEAPAFTPPGPDIALLSAGTTVEAHSPILHPSLKIEGAIDGSDLDEDGAVSGGPDESYPHWFVLNFNQTRTIGAIEIQWLDRSYGQDWEVSYYDGQNWQLLKAEIDWQPTPNYIYRYLLPEPVEATKIRLQVNWASGGRLAVRRFSVYGE